MVSGGRCAVCGERRPKVAYFVGDTGPRLNWRLWVGPTLVEAASGEYGLCATCVAMIRTSGGVVLIESFMHGMFRAFRDLRARFVQFGEDKKAADRRKQRRRAGAVRRRRSGAAWRRR